MPFLTDASVSQIFDSVHLRCHHGIFGESVSSDKPVALLLIHKPTWQEKGEYKSKKQSGLRRNQGADAGHADAGRANNWGRATSSTDEHWEKRGVNRQRSPPVGTDPNLASRNTSKARTVCASCHNYTNDPRRCATCRRSNCKLCFEGSLCRHIDAEDCPMGNPETQWRDHPTATTQASPQQQCRACLNYTAFTLVRHCGCALCNLCHQANACTCHAWRSAK